MSKIAKRAGSKISYSLEDPDVCMYVLEALYDGVVSANIVEMARLYPNFSGLHNSGIVYEDPQPVSSSDPDQHLGTLSQVLKKGRATCIEAAAIVAAEERREGRDAAVRLIPQEDSYGTILPYEYHAVVELEDGSYVDPSKSLPGYTPSVGGRGALDNCVWVTRPYVGPPGPSVGPGGSPCSMAGVRAQNVRS